VTELDVAHDEALGDAAAATVRLVLAIAAWQDALDALGKASAARRDHKGDHL
jgi:hypothetical protein